MTTPPAPSANFDLQRVLRQQLVWRVEPAYKFWLTTRTEEGARLFMRINPTFPDDHLYSLLVGEDETVEFDDLPDRWRRDGFLAWPDSAEAGRPE